MITVETRNNPQFLIDKLIAFLNEKSIDTWEIDDEDDFTLCSEKYRFKAWMTIDKRIKNKAFNICIIESKKYPMTKSIYAAYHCKFAEVLLEYFDTDIKHIEISSLLVDGYDKFKKVANHAEEI